MGLDRRAAALTIFLAASLTVAIVGFATGNATVAAVGGVASVLGGTFALATLAIQRREHTRLETEAGSQEAFLDQLGSAFDAIAAPADPADTLERLRVESSRLFRAKVDVLPPGAPLELTEGTETIPLRGRDELGTLRIERQPPLERYEALQARVLADFATRTSENAGLIAQAKEREAERARLSDQLITAEQEERRRIALYLHDGPVQNLAGIALMLDATQHSIETGKLDEARTVLASALERHRDTIRALRDLSFNLEPVVLRDQGFEPAVRGLAEQLGISNQIQIDLDVAAADRLAEQAQVVLYQILREALNQAIRRGPPTRISIAVADRADGGVETVIADDGGSERRRASFDAIAERARTLNGQISVDRGEKGTTVRVTLPAYTARG